MGKFGSSRLAGKALQQVPGASVVGDAIGGAVKNINPGLYDLMFNEQTLKQINTGPANKFTTDWKGGLNDGSVKAYFDNKSQAKQADLRKHWEAQDPEQQAFLTNIYGEAATRNSDASIYVNSLEDALQAERLKEVQINKRRRVAATQQPVDLGTVESPAPQKQIRTQSTELFDDLNREVYGEEWDNVLSEEGLEGMGRTQKGPEGELIPNKQSVFIQQRQAQLSPHHLSEKSFDLKAIENWNRGEQVQFVRDMNSIDVFPGNHPRNWLGALHDNTGTLIKRQQAKIQALRKEAGAAGVIDKVTGKPYAPLPRRKLDDWYKADAHAPDKASPEYSRVELESADPEIQAGAKADLARGPLKRDWSEILPPGKTINDIQVDSVVISRDHQEFIHGITNKLESTLRIKRLIKEGKWDTLPYKQRFILMAVNAMEKQNVAFNVSLVRIQKIRKAMGKPNAKWDDIVAWMAQNPERAGSIGWHAELARGGDILNQLDVTLDELTADLKPKELNLVSNVFGMKQPPKTSAKFKQWLVKNG